MPLQLSTSARNAMLDALETATGTAPVLNLYNGTIPANCAAADAGTLLCSVTLPSDWLAAASGGSKAKAGTWAGTASVTGTPTYFRLKTSGGTTMMQGTVSDTSGTGDMQIDTLPLVASEDFAVASFILTAPGA